MRKLLILVSIALVVIVGCSKSSDSSSSSSTTSSTTSTTSTTTTTSTTGTSNSFILTGDSTYVGGKEVVVFNAVTANLIYTSNASIANYAKGDGNTIISVIDTNVFLNSKPYNVELTITIKGKAIGSYGLATGGNTMNLVLTDKTKMETRTYDSEPTSSGTISISQFDAVGGYVVGTFGDKSKPCTLSIAGGLDKYYLNITAGKFRVKRGADLP